MDHSHDHLLMFASLAVAMMAGFTGLTLVAGATAQEFDKRKRSVTMAAIALGGGIWSMHFVAMLGVKMPIEYFYEPVTTLASALVAIIVVGIALLMLHFGPRNKITIPLAGIIVGVGILAMHYIGMSAMRGAVPHYTFTGIVLAVIVSLLLNIFVFWLAYGKRTRTNIFWGTLVFGVAVFAVHFTAMVGTHFEVDPNSTPANFVFSNSEIGIFVALGTFFICGSFLLSGVNFISEIAPNGFDANPEIGAPLQTSVGDVVANADEVTEHTQQLAGEPEVPKTPAERTSSRIPYEKNGRSYFISSDDVAAVRAEGHYTHLYTADSKLFCPWSISEFSKRIDGDEFMRVHRSYFLNPSFVSSFERTKDNGVCYLNNINALDRVPVSRSHISKVRELLGLD